MSKRKIPSLIVENISDTGNLNMLSLLEHRREQYLVIVDNLTEDVVGAYVLDYARQEGIDLKTLIDVADEWVNAGAKHPLSFEFSRLGLTEVSNRIFKTFDTAHVTRLVGRAFQFDVSSPPKVKKRRANQIASVVEIRPVLRGSQA